MRRFEGKTAVITGASHGVGLAMARRFAEEGANLVIGSIANRLPDAVEALRSLGAKVEGVHCDVSKKTDVMALYDTAENVFGGVDISVQNAGIITIAKIEHMTEREWDRALDVNTKGVFLCCQEAIFRMRKYRRGGRLINTASGQARDGLTYTPHYAASKFGVVGLTQSLAKEVAVEGITVNAICPGIIQSDKWEYLDEVWGRLFGKEQANEYLDDCVANVPMKRLGSGSEVAGLVAFLASEDAAYITGQAINVDGGLKMS